MSGTEAVVYLTAEIARARAVVVVASVGGDLRGPEVHHLRLHASAVVHRHAVPSRVVRHGWWMVRVPLLVHQQCRLVLCPTSISWQASIAPNETHHHIIRLRHPLSLPCLRIATRHLLVVGCSIDAFWL